MGQFATPPPLAREVMRLAKSHLLAQKVEFLEPSVGSGSFYSALLDEVGVGGVASAVGVEVDPRFAALSEKLWGETGLRVVQGDFLDYAKNADIRANFLVANPPYVRHHHLEGSLKRDLKDRVRKELDIDVSGLSGLYVYFILLSHRLLASDATSTWLIPSEFLDTNYGKALRTYLSEFVTLERIHRFEPEGTKFEDALVTSSVVVFTNRPPIAGHLVALTQGDHIDHPDFEETVPLSSLSPARKWGPLFQPSTSEFEGTAPPRLDSYFRIRRGVATGDQKFFVLDRKELEARGISRSSVIPILPPPRQVNVQYVGADDQGYPLLEPQLALISPKGNTVDEVRTHDSKMADYLSDAPERTLSSYLVRNRRVWFQPERREPAPFLLTYMGRTSSSSKAPFRFILNRSAAIATNSYLMLYPIGGLATAIEDRKVTLEEVFEALNHLPAAEMINGGRVYGGGLRKIEPRELAALDASAVAQLLSFA